MSQIMPYVMTGRNDSCIYYRMTARLDNIQKYIVRKRREGVRITLFNIIVTAMLRTVSERPRVNRFIAGRRIYQHKDFEVLYVVKQKMTDDGEEMVCRVKFEPGDKLMDVKNAMDKHIRSLKNGELKDDDKLIRHLARYPRWSKRLIYRILTWMDFNGIMPKALIETLPFYSTVFISHLGTLGGDAAFHHLYEFGTNSIFMTIGRPYEQPYHDEEGGVSWRKVVDIAFTIDERICDGFYLVKTLRVFQQLLDRPELLEGDQEIHEDERDLSGENPSRPNEALKDLVEGDSAFALGVSRPQDMTYHGPDSDK